LIPKVTGWFESLPNDYGKGNIPRPPIEAGKKMLDYIKQNALPKAGLAIGFIGMVI